MIINLKKIEIYKMKRSVDRIVRIFLSAWKCQRPEGIALKWQGQNLKEMCGASYFIQKVLGAWNMLLAVVVETGTIVEFKRLFDRHLDIRGMEEYESC